MNERLLEIIRYKTGGKQTPFAELMGWSPQYLAKLLKGCDFGLKPVISILSTFPEISPRWFLLGEGSMLEAAMMFDLQRTAMNHIQRLLNLDRYIPVMTAEELNEFTQAVGSGREPQYSPSDLSSMEQRLTDRMNSINAKFAAATAQSDRLCKRRTVK